MSALCVGITFGWRVLVVPLSQEVIAHASYI
jgi:hypothetical protein